MRTTLKFWRAAQQCDIAVSRACANLEALIMMAVHFPFKLCDMVELVYTRMRSQARTKAIALLDGCFTNGVLPIVV